VDYITSNEGCTTHAILKNIEGVTEKDLFEMEDRSEECSVDCAPNCVYSGELIRIENSNLGAVWYSGGY
jgi:hypothetical protein